MATFFFCLENTATHLHLKVFCLCLTKFGFCKNTLDLHNSCRDWWHNTATLPNSAILRAVRSPVIAMTLWATVISVTHRTFLTSRPTIAKLMCIPSTPHSLMVSALGLLLVFRTNSAYQRFVVCRVYRDLNNAQGNLCTHENTLSFLDVMNLRILTHV